MSDNRLTERARKVISLARQEAVDLNHKYVGTEHLLLGMVEEGSGVAATVLKDLGADSPRIRKELESLAPRGADPVKRNEQLPFTPSAKRTLEIGLEETKRLGHNYVGTEHLLLGLARTKEGIGAQVLQRLGVAADTVRTSISRLLATPTAPVAGASSGGHAERSADFHSYLLRTIATLNASRAAVPAVIDAAEEAATRLAAGGALRVLGSPAMVSELCSRAGGLMMIRATDTIACGDKDVVLRFPPEDAAPAHGATGGDALIVTFGGPAPAPGGHHISHCADAGGVSPSLAVMILGWMFTGELIGALMRRGRMPVVYESIGAYGGVPRINRFKNGEIAFHEELNVPPVRPGVIAGRYTQILANMLVRVDLGERDKLNCAGLWIREARSRGRRPFMYSMGHVVPYEISDTEIGRAFRTGTWLAGFPRHPKPDDVYEPGDVVVHIGYQHPPEDLLRKARAADARAVYVSVRADRDFAHDPNVIWIDPMWDWADACVPLDGYDVPILPASGVVNAAIAWEIYRLGQC